MDKITLQGRRLETAIFLKNRFHEFLPFWKADKNYQKDVKLVGFLIGCEVRLP